MGETIFDTMVRFFKEDEWKFQQLEDRPILQLGFSGRNGSWMCYAQAKNEQERFLFYSVLETKAVPERRVALSEFLTRANYGLVLGNFEMDFSDGEIRYKTSIDVEGGQLTTQMVKTLVYTNVLMMDKYLPGIMSVLYASVPPEQALAAVEGR